MSRGFAPVRSGTYRAVFAAGAPRAALAQVLEALGRGEDPARAVVVKRSTTRHLVRLELSDGTAVYVKRYITRTPGAGLRSLLGRSRAAQEYRNLVRLRALGLPAVEPLCFAERRHWRWLRDAVLVTRVVPDALRLDEHFERLDAATRPAVIDELARLVRRLHDAGWWHRDLHAGNVLAARASAVGNRRRLILVDVQKLRALPGALPTALRVRDLGTLHHALERRLTVDERTRLLQGYAAVGPPLEVAPLLAAVERAAAQRVRVRLRSRGRRCVVRSTGFRIERARPYRIYRRADVPTAGMLHAIEIHRRILTEGPQTPGFVKRDAATAVSRVDGVLGGPPPGRPPSLADRGQGAAEPGAPARAAVAVKEFHDRPLRALLAHPLRRHRGMAAWRGAHALLLRGFETPAPLALVEERRFGWLRRSYLLTRWEEGTESLWLYLDRRFACGPPASEVAAVRACGRFVSRLHAAGIYQPDLGPWNLLVREDGDPAPEGSGAIAFLLLDLEAVRFGQRLSQRRRVESLARLVRGVASRLPRIQRTQLARFLIAYCAADAGVGAAWRELFADLVPGADGGAEARRRGSAPHPPRASLGEASAHPVRRPEKR